MRVCNLISVGEKHGKKEEQRRKKKSNLNGKKREGCEVCICRNVCACLLKKEQRMEWELWMDSC